MVCQVGRAAWGGGVNVLSADTCSSTSTHANSIALVTHTPPLQKRLYQPLPALSPSRHASSPPCLLFRCSPAPPLLRAPGLLNDPEQAALGVVLGHDAGRLQAHADEADDLWRGGRLWGRLWGGLWVGCRVRGCKVETLGTGCKQGNVRWGLSRQWGKGLGLGLVGLEGLVGLGSNGMRGEHTSACGCQGTLPPRHAFRRAPTELVHTLPWV